MGHLHILEEAKKYLTSRYSSSTVVAGVLAPSSDLWIKTKYGAEAKHIGNPKLLLSTEQRSELCRLAVEDAAKMTTINASSHGTGSSSSSSSTSSSSSSSLASTTTSSWVHVCDWGIAKGRDVMNQIERDLIRVYPTLEDKLILVELGGSDFVSKRTAPLGRNRMLLGFQRLGMAASSTIAGSNKNCQMVELSPANDFSATLVRHCLFFPTSTCNAKTLVERRIISPRMLALLATMYGISLDP